MDLRISLLNFNLAMIDISYGILILHKNHVSKIFSNAFLRSIIGFSFLKKFFSQHIVIEENSKS